jgi:hypothetical protein
LAGRVTYTHARLVDVELQSADVVVSNHACGALTDRVLEAAAAAGARVAVLPCCHDGHTPAARILSGWLDGALALDTWRAFDLQARGYDVWTQAIPAEITPKHRLLMAKVRTDPAPSGP